MNTKPEISKRSLEAICSLLAFRSNDRHEVDYDITRDGDAFVYVKGFQCKEDAQYFMKGALKALGLDDGADVDCLDGEWDVSIAILDADVVRLAKEVA